MTNREQTIANFELCWASLIELASTLNADQWQTQSLCPEWTVAGIAGHLISVEDMLSGWLPEGENTPDFGRVQTALERTALMSGPELVAALTEVTDRRRSDLAATTDEIFDTPSFTPVGRQTYGRFMAIRVFDFWVHEQDVRTPLGIPGHEGGPAAEMALDEVRRSMGYIAGKLIGLGDDQSMVFSLTGGVESEIAVAVDGRAAVVDTVSNPTAVVDADFVTFMLLACGRIDPQGAIDSGKISWSGDAALGERGARNLKFTM